MKDVSAQCIIYLMINTLSQIWLIESMLNGSRFRKDAMNISVLVMRLGVTLW